MKGMSRRLGVWGGGGSNDEEKNNKWVTEAMAKLNVGKR